MPCSECSHCQSKVAGSTLRLPDPPSNRGRAGVDLAFYAAFGIAYDRARAMGPQPMRRLREVNPWLSDSQCRSYLKRARAMRLVQSPARAVTPVPEPAPSAPRGRAGGRGRAAAAADPDLDLLDAIPDDRWDAWQEKGQPVTAAQVAQWAPRRLSESAAQRLVDDAIRAGLVDADQRMDGAFRIPGHVPA